MGPPENPTRHSGNQERACPRRPARLPRTRRCLLKGCERRFRPGQARERYCSQECRRAARKWSCWKARQSYRATAAGKQKRNGQSRRYRERVRNRQQRSAATSRSRSEGHHSRFFSITVVTAPAATKDSRSNAGHHANDSVRARAGGPWNACGSANGVGARLRGAGGGFRAAAHGR